MSRPTIRIFGGAMAIILLFAGVVALVDRTTSSDGPRGFTTSTRDRDRFPGQLGQDSAKIRRDGERTYVWADGPMTGTSGVWFDFTDAPLNAAELQYGIGRDQISAIDDPLFVPPDDARLLSLAPNPYRPPARLTNVNKMRIIGVYRGGEARAYPLVLLNHHELVNDVIGGKPVTVGW